LQLTDGTLCSSFYFSEAIGVVHPESSSTLAAILFLPQNEISIIISGLLPDFSLGGACFDFLWLIESLEGEAFCVREVRMVNCLLTTLYPQRVVSIDCS
jgi:hypothetical protein